MLSLLTYNILFGKKLEKIIQWYKNLDEKIDVVCFQEFPHNKIKWLTEQIGKPMDYRFTPSIERKKQKYGELTMVISDRIKFNDEEIVILGTGRFEKFITRNKGSKKALINTLQYKKKRLVLANTHLATFALNKRRIKELSQIIYAINQLPGKDKAIITGDFNYSSLIRQKGLIKFMNNNYFKNATQKVKTHRIAFLKHQLDYVFYRNCKIKDVKVLRLNYSDHYPIITHLDLD